jgi:hypothetical protein
MLLCVRKADFTVADTHHHPHVPINSVLQSLNPRAGEQLQLFNQVS